MDLYSRRNYPSLKLKHAAIHLKRIDQNELLLESRFEKESPEIIRTESSVTRPKFRELKRYACKGGINFKNSSGLSFLSFKIRQKTHHAVESDFESSIASVTDTLTLSQLELTKPRLIDLPKMKEELVMHIQRLPETYRSGPPRLKASEELTSKLNDDGDIVNPKTHNYTCKLCPRRFKTASGFYLHTIGGSHKSKAQQSFPQYENLELKPKNDSLTSQSPSEQIKASFPGSKMKQPIICLPRISENITRTSCRSKESHPNTNTKPEADTLTPCFPEFPNKWKWNNESFRTLAAQFSTQESHKKAQMMYSCNQCEQNCSSRVALFSHQLKQHDLQRRLPKLKHDCKFCGKKFSSKHKLQSHMFVHTKEKNFQCPKCLRSFSFNFNLTRHLQTHKGVQCLKCKLILPSARKLKSHVKHHHGKQIQTSLKVKRSATSARMKNPTVCGFCGKNFQFHTSLERHMVVHTKEKPYQCNLCQESFSWKEMLKSHSKNHTSKDIQCVQFQCELRFPTQNQMEFHAKEHGILFRNRKFPCDTCAKVFQNSKALKCHSKRHKPPLKFQCPKCTKKYRLKCHLTLHLRNHGNGGKTNSMVYNLSSNQPELLQAEAEPIPNPTEPIVDETADKVYPPDSEPMEHDAMYPNSNNHNKVQPETSVIHSCKTCGKVFKYKYNLKRHLSVHSGEKRFQCHICQARFSTKSAQSRHTEFRSCRINKVFKCKHCDEQFRKKVSLKLHIRSQHKEQKFICTQCNKSVPFVKITQHMNSHTRQQAISDAVPIEYQCNLCPSILQTKNNLKRHVEGHERIGKCKCPDCDLTFWRQIDLLRHKAEVHLDLPLPEAGSKECKVCQKSFTCTYNLLRHLKTHVKIHTCQHCSWTFQTKYNLERHLKSHEPKSFRCSVCNIQFPSQVCLKSHNLKEHAPKKTNKTVKEDMCLLCRKPLFRCTDTPLLTYKCVEPGCKSAFLTNYQLQTLRLMAFPKKLHPVLEDHGYATRDQTNRSCS